MCVESSSSPPLKPLSQSRRSFAQARALTECRCTRAQVWLFAREPAEIQITEVTKVADNYGYALTLLVMPEAEKRWRLRDADDETVEDSYDRFTR